MAKFRYQGDTVPYTPVAAVVAGQLVKHGTYVGVADNPIAANALGALRVVGVYEVEMATLSGPAAFGAELDINFTTQKAVAGGSGDSDVRVFLAEPAASGSDVKLKLFLNRVGG
jgi:predicted RecA/RadA family phage recombinase